jgi:hypothetical protein
VVAQPDESRYPIVFNNFELLMESLICVVQISCIPSGQGQSDQSMQAQESNVRNISIEILTYLIKINYRKNNNQADLVQFRENLLVTILKAYSPDVAPQHQCITNQVAEDLLEWLAISSSMDFVSATIVPLLGTEQPPRLQAVLRMVSNKLKYLQKIKAQGQDVDSAALYDHVSAMAEVLSYLMKNANADVRKSVVFCLVEIHSSIQDDHTFNDVFMQKLNQSQQKLVDIYI